MLTISGTEYVLNSLLRETENLCMLCGAPGERPKPAKPDDDEDEFDVADNGRAHPLCKACRAAYGLVTTKEGAN